MFSEEGINMGHCGTVDGGKQGNTCNLITCEILLYTDAKTGKSLKTWTNPWTGEEVEVLQVLNEPVNQPARFPRDKD
ncbi:hypothetical protein BAE46_13375 [Glaciecola punicea]|jgi:hypothetical protein|uniref:DUF1838 family protein n=1 Tax=Glaciecola punicea TaxID=56804 RepID=UPI00087245D4|nr:DUF1838 family protein [Glaciecola punicea]OFA29871.1 hypothetical protein BAE46_13375 [Glaciecola punicea]